MAQVNHYVWVIQWISDSARLNYHGLDYDGDSIEEATRGFEKKILGRVVGIMLRELTDDEWETWETCGSHSSACWQTITRLFYHRNY